MLGTLVLMIALCVLVLFLSPRRRDVLGATEDRSLVHSIQAAYAAGRISKAEARHLWKRAILQKLGW